MSKPKDNLPAKAVGGKAATKQDQPMSVVDHLGEVRKRLVSVALVLVTLAVVCFLFIDHFVQALLNLGEQFSFVYLAPAELVSAYFRLTLICALVIASPFIIYQIWAFVSPALSNAEKRTGFFGLMGGLGFFVIGAAFAYFVAIPFMLDFFANFGNLDAIRPSISFENYINYLMSTLVSFGLVFELPILTLLLSAIGLLKPEFMVKTRKYAMLIIFVLAAIITPPDVVSQVMVAIPMILLYEISIAVCRMIVRRKRAKAAAEEADEDYGKDEEA